jgi:hypothetical protein
MKKFAVLVVVLVLALGFTCTACDYEASCPMHNISSRASGRDKFTNGGQKHWAEYRCPGIPTEGGSEPPHTFWVECD